jgi:hypothetical protein
LERKVLKVPQVLLGTLVPLVPQVLKVLKVLKATALQVFLE